MTEEQLLRELRQRGYAYVSASHPQSSGSAHSLAWRGLVTIVKPERGFSPLLVELRGAGE
jgi:hypothetical protein